MNYYAGYVPIMRDTAVLGVNAKKQKPKESKTDALGLIRILNSDSELWLMMGSTNAAVALGAFRKGVRVRQISHSRAIGALRGTEKEKSSKDGSRRKISAEDVFNIAQNKPGLFYPVHPEHADALEIIQAWNDLDEAMKARKAYANRVRSRIMTNAVTSGQFVSKKDLEKEIDRILGNKKKKIEPEDPSMQHFLGLEKEADKMLGQITKKSDFYGWVFGPIDGVGPKLAARFTTAIERIERFPEPTDLSNFAGMLPRGPERRLPSKRLSSKNGHSLSRNPLLNTSCFLLQDQMFTWGAKTELGQILHGQVERTCPCTKEERDQDKELRRKHMGAVKEARIAMTRHFLEEMVYPSWHAYMNR